MSLPVSHPDFWTRALQFTPTIHRDVYPALYPETEKIRGIAKGKIVLVTGAGSGFGKVNYSPPSSKRERNQSMQDSEYQVSSLFESNILKGRLHPMG